MSEKNSRKNDRKRAFETFEQRLVMSAHGLTDVAVDNYVEVPDLTQQVEVRTQLDEINDAFGVNNVREQYQFDGTGQTVAVIDSGIAWDHLALGGGYGEDYRVVGGWDFAENDANPYDDGPAGFHGTHVTGIIGSSDETHTGVASGVDIVGLRVFDDSGGGDFAWVEEALQWVHENKDAFENPITTVNLSLGADWNANTIPDWATLEDEFQQLEADGIFIAVAAGNSFDQYNEAGLAYPAVSEHVVPVSSHDVNGNISDFSQRNHRVLVAPGETVTSTVPGYLNAGPENNSFLGATGASMASPFVAGASTLLRQANEFVGVQNIDQDLLYQQFVDSADAIYDSVTGGYYNRINLENAIASVITDIHSDYWGSATNGGDFVGGELISGTIGQVDDVDKFVFTASRNGEVTLNLTTTHDLRAAVEVIGAQASVNGNQVKFQVQEGQQYHFSVGTSDGIGHYDVAVELTDTFIQGENWGVIQSNTFSENITAGENWYQLTASRNGLLSLAAHVPNSGNVQFELYDSSLQQIGTTNSQGDFTRLTANVTAGQTVSLKVTSDTSNQFNVHASNQLAIQDGQLVVFGTTGDDRFDVTVGDSINVNVNGTNHQFTTDEISAVRIAGLAGNDTLNVEVNDHVDQAVIRNGTTRVSSDDFDVIANGMESISIDVDSGDWVQIFDSAGNDTLTNELGRVTMTGGTFEASADGFDKVFAYASSGYDTANLHGTSGNDYFTSTESISVLKNTDQEFVTRGWDALAVSSGGGDDIANIFDSASNDQFVLRPNSGHLNAGDYQVWVGGFSNINAHSVVGGYDSVELHDSAGNDFFRHRNDQSILTGEGYLNVARGMEWVQAIASSGNDTAQIYDTIGNDTLRASTNFTSLQTGNNVVSAAGFNQVTAIANAGGFDTAFLNGTDGTDFVAADAGSVTIVDANQNANVARGFSEVTVDTRGGQDFTALTGSQQRDVLRALDAGIDFETTMQLVQLVNSENVSFDGNGGNDEILLDDFDRLDLLEAIGDKATAYLNNVRIEASDFSYLEAATKAGATSNHDIEAVDFLFLLDGNWQSQ